jgi:hypothetical protein
MAGHRAASIACPLTAAAASADSTGPVLTRIGGVYVASGTAIHQGSRSPRAGRRQTRVNARAPLPDRGLRRD